MSTEGPSCPVVGSDSQDSQDEMAPPIMSGLDLDRTSLNLPKLENVSSSTSTPNSGGRKLLSSKGIENAKKRLRAFSIQKKVPITPLTVPKPVGSGSTTVLIGKLSSVKTTPKTNNDEEAKKLPKPPKPGCQRKYFQDSYTDLQKRTLSEIEDMKRKMELVELGIPLGLICPSSNSDKAMPTKAMPPIKSFLDPAKVDEIIREAKKAKAEGREFKFDYQKLLPDYDNPFQRKKEDSGAQDKDKPDKYDRRKSVEKDKNKDRERYRRSDRYDVRRHSDYKRDDRNRHKDKSREKDLKTKHKEEKSKDREVKNKEGEVREKEEKNVEIKFEAAPKFTEKDVKEADVNLNDYLVCDSWSLDNASSSPQVDEKSLKSPAVGKDMKYKDPMEQLRESLKKNEDSPKDRPIKKIERLQPVIDSFKYEIDPKDDEILGICDEDSDLEKFSSATNKYESENNSQDSMTDDNFLESVINEIKEEDLADESSQDKGLVEYDSPIDDSFIKNDSVGSVTPELESNMSDPLSSQRSDYSNSSISTGGYKSAESGYKSMESGYRSDQCQSSLSRQSPDSFRLSIEKEIDDPIENKISKSTMESLDTWSFVLKICQPLLFRHDKNKCYKETHTEPKIWYTLNPKVCNCVKDRAIVYEELETCKMSLVDRVYGCDQIQDTSFPTKGNWYPRINQCLNENTTIHLSTSPNEWEAEEVQLVKDKIPEHEKRKTTTPQPSDETELLNREYQRFMDAVWPEASDSNREVSRSTTPVKQEARKKRIGIHKDDKKKAKKLKVSGESWSQESDFDDDGEKSNKKDKIEKERSRKRKRSSSTLSSTTDDDASKKKRKLLKKKTSKKAKLRRRRLEKIKKKLKEKQKKKKKHKEYSDDGDDDDEKEYKKDKKSRKKKQKLKKKTTKKKKIKTKSSSSSSETSISSSSESSDSESSLDRKKSKKKEEEARRKKKGKKKRKKSTSESTQSEDLFDVNVLNNIKTERLTDDEKSQKKLTDQEFSPRRQQKPRQEIINVKELQNDLVGNVNIKQEIEEEVVNEPVTETKGEVEVQNDLDKMDMFDLSSNSEQFVEKEKIEFKEPKELNSAPPEVRPVVEESNLSQCSSQESVCSIKDQPVYEKDESHLRPSSQNSNYSFNDVIASQNAYKNENENVMYKGMESEDKFENYEPANYEMYEQMAMAYQSEVASQVAGGGAAAGAPGCEGVGGAGGGGGAGAGEGGVSRIETVVRARARGEIKCDWRPGDRGGPQPPPQRPSRWGLKPSDVNIVLTGGNNEQYPILSVVPAVYQIENIANRNDNSTGYDEAYMDMYGAADRLQYGDCFGESPPAHAPGPPPSRPPLPLALAAPPTSLDERIDRALRETVLGEVAKEPESEEPSDAPEKGILVVKNESRSSKRVSFADGYKPGQDSDEERPKKKRKARRYGCAWPCPASHPDHVPLWDALPPPPPPPGPPAGVPVAPPAGPPARPLAGPPAARPLGPPPAPRRTLLPAPLHGYDPSTSLGAFMPPEPPPGLISFS